MTSSIISTSNVASLESPILVKKRLYKKILHDIAAEPSEEELNDSFETEKDFPRQRKK